MGQPGALPHRAAGGFRPHAAGWALAKPGCGMDATGATNTAGAARYGKIPKKASASSALFRFR
jgi:hypothetical protein